jgi:hypothetical protein
MSDVNVKRVNAISSSVKTEELSGVSKSIVNVVAGLANLKGGVEATLRNGQIARAGSDSFGIDHTKGVY